MGWQKLSIFFFFLLQKFFKLTSNHDYSWRKENKHLFIIPAVKYDTLFIYSMIYKHILTIGCLQHVSDISLKFFEALRGTVWRGSWNDLSSCKFCWSQNM